MLIFECRELFEDVLYNGIIDIEKTELLINRNLLEWTKPIIRKVLEMKNSEIKISIIVPIYNAEKYLLKCINSILAQIHHNLQIILIDDGSSDHSLSVCKLMREKDSRIEVYHTENHGSVAARKLGLEKSVGKYIGFVDSDDYIESDMFMELLDILINSNADFVHSGYIEENDKEENEVCDFKEAIVDLDNIEYKVSFLKKYILEQSAECFITPSIWSKLFKAELIKKCFRSLSDDQQYGEDFICLCRCIFESRRVALSRKMKYHYVVGKHTLSHLKYDEYMMKEIGLWYHILKVMKEYNCMENIKDVIYDFYKRRMLEVVLADEKKKIPIPYFYYGNMSRIVRKKIVLFGAGRVGQDYYLQMSKYKNCQIVIWIDSNWNEINFDYADVVGIKNIKEVLFDIVIIAINDEKIAMEMRNKLINIGIPEKKIDWRKPGIYY